MSGGSSQNGGWHLDLDGVALLDIYDYKRLEHIGDISKNDSKIIM